MNPIRTQPRTLDCDPTRTGTQGRIWAVGSAALIAGTTVGTGVLALPEITGPSGFVPSSEVLVAMWIYSCDWILLAEVNLATLCALGNSKDEVSLFSVARSTLGEAGAVVFSIAYVFMHECLIIACCLKG